MNRISHFEIHASEPEKLAKFYTDVFGWEITKWENNQNMDYWMVATGKADEPGGINGGLVRRSGTRGTDGQSPNAFVCTIVVDDYDGYHEKILAAGGIVALPKMALAGMAWQGYYLDPDKNLFGLHQADTNAK
jgi:predicted enzyme related to lactoylglutathione lyase